MGVERAQRRGGGVRTVGGVTRQRHADHRKETMSMGVGVATFRHYFQKFNHSADYCTSIHRSRFFWGAGILLSNFQLVSIGCRWGHKRGGGGLRGYCSVEGSGPPRGECK